ncbi:AAA family ATPase [Marixanthomonas spongiae]|uniref:RecF/RecN/SMC N-terminal domain-containing protein n=1 Tax=Marixanthomonas spongiae TaxID=2174845 RepID=A0A2U0HZN6_9FLAO|nr:AAA family ATPase [Marixanthomonas spongiae]PVW14342.1 hypothetical protein DDV96_11125 [Marixanthomonas spongiae]
MSKEKYIITKLEAKNYKFIEHGIYNIDDKNLVVLDGPNGYGKTTLFDAIEIIIVGKPRRIEENNNILRNYSYTDSPIHNDKSLPIQLTLTLENENKDKLEISRFFESSPDEKSIRNNPQKIYDSSSLTINLNNEKIDITINEALRYYNINLFNVFNYVEQDENTFFLKKNPKDKYKVLAGLLGVEEQIAELNLLSNFLKSIGSKISSISEGVNEKEVEIKELIGFSGEFEYKKLLDEVDLHWDQEGFELKSFDVRNTLLSEMDNLKNLVKNKDNISKIKKAIYLTKLKNNDNFIKDLVKYYWSVNNIEILDKENKKRREVDANIESNKKIIEWIDTLHYTNLKDKTTLSFLETIENLKNEKDRFLTIVNLIISLRESLSTENKILDNLKNRRDSLVDYYKTFYEELNLNDSECPVCGFEWETHQKLIEQIKETEVKILQSFNANSKKLEDEKERLKKEFLNKIRSKIILKNESISKFKEKLIEIQFYNLVKDKELLLSSTFNEFFEFLEKDEKEKIFSIVNKRTIENKSELEDRIRNIIDGIIPSIDDSINISQVESDFKKYFDNNLSALKEFDGGKIEDKIKYFDYLFHKFTTNTISELASRLKKLKSVEERVEKIKGILDTKIKEYLTNIISTISIPFYIYTGKILQEHSLGSGLMFDADINNVDPQIKIKPLNREQEASYTLSSGQLSATVISLMLVLNKVYNTSKLGVVLIDDPVQTLDEINTHSLVELLKYNFSDQQIIMSTHEDRYSKFMRYKFDKFGLSSKSLNMKNLYN